VGKRGPPPKPTVIKILNGNPGKRPLPDNEPQPAPATGLQPPGWLKGHAMAIWQEIVPELERLGLLTLLDRAAVLCYCQAWAEFLLSTEVLEKDGRYVQRGTGGLASHPAIAQQRTAWRAIKDFSALFGLDPSSRSRISVPQKADEDDPMSEFLKGGA
jgi:P27 family predicted phage terminase small subunit